MINLNMININCLTFSEDIQDLIIGGTFGAFIIITISIFLMLNNGQKRKNNDLAPALNVKRLKSNEQIDINLKIKESPTYPGSFYLTDLNAPSGINLARLYPNLNLVRLPGVRPVHGILLPGTILSHVYPGIGRGYWIDSYQDNPIFNVTSNNRPIAKSYDNAFCFVYTKSWPGSR